MSTENYFWIGSRLVEHLRQAMPELMGVCTINDTSALADNAQASPVAHVLYVSDEAEVGPQSQGTVGKKQVVTQLWCVVISVYYGQDSAVSNNAQDVAGPLISKMLRVVSGWQPDPTAKPLMRGRPMPANYVNGFAFFPFVFRASFVF